MSLASAILVAIRPKTLTVSASPVILGGVAAAQAGQPDWALAGLCFAGAALLQIVSNVANDVFDARKGADGPDRKGPLRAVASGLLSEKQAFVLLGVAVVFALVVGAFILRHGGWPIAAIGLSGLLAAVLYTAGPYPLGYHGFGDLFVLLYFGFAAVLGTTWVCAGVVTPLGVLLGLAAGCFAMAVLAVNNIRDRDGDARVGKRTLAVRLGASGARALYIAEVAIPFVLLGAAIALRWLPSSCALAFLALPGVIANVAVVRRTDDGPALNRVLVRTAATQISFAAGIAVGA